VRKTARGGPRLVAPEQSRTTRVRALRPLDEPDTLVLIVSGPLARADVEAVCERVLVLLEDSNADQIVCDVSALVDRDAVAVEALARLQLLARRRGRRMRIRNACGELQGLLTLAGLRDVLPCS